MAKYLYGASVQGIQGFIFETNKLKEIVGASDLIEQFCSLDFLEKFSNEFDFNIKESDVLRNAGANIRIAFEKREDIEKMVKYFPQYIMNRAYGITISQAVVEFDDNNYLLKKDELERKLTEARNRASIPLDSHFSLMKQTPRTGKPAYKNEKYAKDKVEYFDKGNWQKKINSERARALILLEKLDLADAYGTFPLDMEEMANKNNKIAIIHADGNKMGLMLQAMNKSLKDKKSKEIQQVFKEFSTQITNSTISAVKEAFEKNFNKEDEIIPFRPVVIGGDDVTVICRADEALGFTRDYLEAFERNTKENFKELVKEYKLKEFENGLTACAGIAYCNKKFPFHYAVDLAEALCTYAKEKSKRKASCLVFHNIQSSYFTDYKKYISNELISKDSIQIDRKLKSLKWITNYTMKLKDYECHRCYFKNLIVKLSFAPYFTENKTPTINSLLEVYDCFSDSDIPLGKYREWLSELNKSHEYAELFLDRVDSIMHSKLAKWKYERLDSALSNLDSHLRLNSLIVNSKTPMADILQLKSVLGGSK